jgi:protein-tyrosine phosphatase/predicted esterase
VDINYLPDDLTKLPGTIGVMSAPGRERELAADLDELAERHGCVVLVSLVSDHELDLLRIADLPERCTERGIRVIRFPFGDFSTPDSIEEVMSLTAEIIRIARRGGMVAIHCWAGLGRTGLVAACCLAARGLSSSDAVAAVRRCRPRAIENRDQEEFIDQFAAILAAAEPRNCARAGGSLPDALEPRSSEAEPAGRVLYCAGANGNPHGARYQALVTAGHDVFAPDYRGLDVATAADIIMYQILDMPTRTQILVGHSFGGAAAMLAALAAARRGATVTGLVLCAPAIFVAQAVMAPSRLPAPPAPSILIHGLHDDVIPIELSRGFAREHDLECLEVSDDHALLRSLDTIIEAVARIGSAKGMRSPHSGDPQA